MIPAPYRRILSRGQLPDSAGGLYNPGAFSGPHGRGLLLRREVDYSWTKPAYVELIQEDMPLGTSYTLPVVGHDPDARIEDARPFRYQDAHLVAHTLWKPHDRRYPIKPRLSQVVWDESAHGPALTRRDDWHLPIICQPVEKNWVLLEHDGTLYTVYCLDPLMLFFYCDGRWILAHSTPNGWEKALGKPPRNSTHLLPFAGGYLGWWHIILDQTYVHGAYWLDQALQLKARTGVLFDGSWVGREDPYSVYKPGVLYVSSQLIQDEEILLFCGEGDAHSGVVTLKTDDVLEALRLRP